MSSLLIPLKSCSDTEEDQIGAASDKSKPKKRKVETTAVDEAANKNSERLGKGETTDTSRVENDFEVRENQDTMPNTANEVDPKYTTMMERTPSSQKTEKMVDSEKASKRKQSKDRPAGRESVVGERKTRKKAIPRSHKHSESTRKRHQALLKLKLKQRKRVSKARLKSYGIVL